MTVAELVERLTALPQTATVLVRSPEENESDIDDVLYQYGEVYIEVEQSLD